MRGHRSFTAADRVRLPPLFGAWKKLWDRWLDFRSARVQFWSLGELLLFVFMPTPEQKPKCPMLDFNWFVIGISIGTGLGVALNDLELWLPVGAALGLFAGFFKPNVKRKD
jgi:hypothetical protein